MTRHAFNINSLFVRVKLTPLGHDKWFKYAKSRGLHGHIPTTDERGYTLFTLRELMHWAGPYMDREPLFESEIELEEE